MAYANDRKPTAFQLALDAPATVTSLRRSGLSDDFVEFIEEESAPLFDRMLVADCISPSEIVQKGEAILAEYGGGVVPPEMVVALVTDVRRLMQ